MRVLFVGLDSAQPLHMALAMRRLGYDVVIVNPYRVLNSSRFLRTWAWHTGALGLNQIIFEFIKLQTTALGRFDVAFVECGDLIGSSSVHYLKTLAERVLLFCRDNPFLPRDGMRWRTWLKALSLYDLFVTTRESTKVAAVSYGAREVLRVQFFADELLHQPRAAQPSDLERFGSPVSFVGTWFPERGAFMQTLLDRGVPLKIIGARWHKAENYRHLKPYLVDGYLSPEDYAGALASAEISIAMLSKGNADVSTSRSIEIPSMGGLLCAERTDEHLGLYKEGVEAIFWSSAEECAELCLLLLRQPERLERIRRAGRRRALSNNHWTEPTMKLIVETALSL